MRSLATYAENVFAGFSHLLNAFTGGSPRYSFSARCGAGSVKGRVWAALLSAVIDALLFNPGHCVEQAQEEGLI